MKHPPKLNSSRQDGAALIVGLILLAVATIVTLLSMSSGQMQERMTSNANNQALAFKAAEAGASDLLGQLNTQLADGGWPSDVEEWLKDEEDVPLDDPDSSRAVSEDDGMGRYWFEGASYDDSSGVLTLVAAGEVRSDNERLAESRVRIAFRGPQPTDFAGNAPAAFSCEGGPCAVQAGAGAPASVDGRDHRTPSGNRREEEKGIEVPCENDECLIRESWPDGDLRHSLAKASVYLDDFENSEIGTQGAGSKPQFCGLLLPEEEDHDEWPGDLPGGGDRDVEDDYYCGEDKDDAPGVVGPDHFEAIDREVPNFDAFFGEDGPGSIGADDGYDDSFGTYADPKVTYIGEGDGVQLGDNAGGVLVVDGGTVDASEISMRGETIFEGLIVLKNGATIDSRGNPDIYGAVVVDSSGQDEDYEPFTGRGRPRIHYSSEALDNAGRAWRTADRVTIQSWRDML